MFDSFTKMEIFMNENKQVSVENAEINIEKQYFIYLY